MIAQHFAAQHVARLHPLQAVMQRDPSAGNGGGASAAISLDHVAVDGDLLLAERHKVDDRAERATDQALDFDRASALFAGGGFAAGALRGRARQHAVFGGDPAASLALEPGRQPLLKRCRDQHMGFAELHETGPFCVFYHAAFQRNRAQFVRCPAARPHRLSSSLFASWLRELLEHDPEKWKPVFGKDRARPKSRQGGHRPST